jgi:hypothetical protein
MKKLTLLVVTAILFSVPIANAATTISVSFNGFDSASSETYVVDSAGTIPFQLLVSGIEPGDTDIFELQFDLNFPSPLILQGPGMMSPSNYGDAVSGWLIKQGGVLNANVYREFSAEFGGGANAIANGTLILSGLEFRVTDGFINGGLTREVYFNNIKGAGS